MPTLPRTPPTPTSNTSGAQHLKIINLLAGSAYAQTSLPCAESFTLDTSTQDSEHDTDFNPDMLPDKGTSTGLYTIWCVVMQLTFSLKTRAAYWANLAVMTSIDRMAIHVGDYYYPDSADTVKYILKDIFLCIIKEQCSDQEEGTWKH